MPLIPYNLKVNDLSYCFFVWGRMKFSWNLKSEISLDVHQRKFVTSKEQHSAYIFIANYPLNLKVPTKPAFTLKGNSNFVYLNVSKLKRMTKYYFRIKILSEDNSFGLSEISSFVTSPGLEDISRCNWVYGFFKDYKFQNRSLKPSFKVLHNINLNSKKTFKNALLYVSSMCFYKIFIDDHELFSNMLLPAFLDYKNNLEYFVYPINELPAFFVLSFVTAEGYFSLQKNNMLHSYFGSSGAISYFLKVSYIDSSEDIFYSGSSSRVVPHYYLTNVFAKDFCYIKDEKFDNMEQNASILEDKTGFYTKKNAYLKNMSLIPQITEPPFLDTKEKIYPKFIEKTLEGYLVDFARVISASLFFEFEGDSLKIEYFKSEEEYTKKKPSSQTEFFYPSSENIKYGDVFLHKVFRIAVISGIKILKKESLYAFFFSSFKKSKTILKTSSSSLNLLFSKSEQSIRAAFSSSIFGKPDKFYPEIMLKDLYRFIPSFFLFQSPVNFIKKILLSIKDDKSYDYPKSVVSFLKHDRSLIIKLVKTYYDNSLDLEFAASMFPRLKSVFTFMQIRVFFGIYFFPSYFNYENEKNVSLLLQATIDYGIACRYMIFLADKLNLESFVYNTELRRVQKRICNGFLQGKGVLKNKSQGTYALILKHELVAQEEMDAVFTSFIKSIKQDGIDFKSSHYMDIIEVLRNSGYANLAIEQIVKRGGFLNSIDNFLTFSSYSEEGRTFFDLKGSSVSACIADCVFKISYEKGGVIVHFYCLDFLTWSYFRKDGPYGLLEFSFKVSNGITVFNIKLPPSLSGRIYFHRALENFDKRHKELIPGKNIFRLRF